MEPRENLIQRFELLLPNHPMIRTCEFDSELNSHEIQRSQRCSVNYSRRMYFQVNRERVQIHSVREIHRDFRIILVEYGPTNDSSRVLGEFLIQASSMDILFVANDTRQRLNHTHCRDTVLIIGISFRRQCEIRIRFQRHLDEWVQQKLVLTERQVRPDPPTINIERDTKPTLVKQFWPTLTATEWYQSQKSRQPYSSLPTIPFGTNRAPGRFFPALPSPSQRNVASKSTTRLPYTRSATEDAWALTPVTRSVVNAPITADALREALMEQPSTSSGTYRAQESRPTQGSIAWSEPAHIDHEVPGPSRCPMATDVEHYDGPYEQSAGEPVEIPSISTGETEAMKTEPDSPELKSLDIEEIPGVIVVSSSPEEEAAPAEEPPVRAPSCRRRVRARNASPPAFDEPIAPKRAPKSVRNRMRTLPDIIKKRLADYNVSFVKEWIGANVRPIYRREDIGEVPREAPGRCVICTDRFMDYQWQCGHLMCTQCARYLHAQTQFTYMECPFCRKRWEYGRRGHPMHGNCSRYISPEQFEREHSPVVSDGEEEEEPFPIDEEQFPRVEDSDFSD